MKRDYLAQCPLVLRSFLGYLENTLGKSPKTVEEYFLDIRTFLRYLKYSRKLAPSDQPIESIEIDDVTIDLLRTVTLSDAYEFFHYVRVDRNNQSAARARKVCSLKAFFKFLSTKSKSSERLESDPLAELDAPKIKRSLPKYLTLEQSIELLNSVEGPFQQRDYCILTLFLNCGLRLSELVGLDLGDIRSDHTMRVTGKGNKERTVYLNEACLTAIENYLKVRPHEGVKDRYALFLSKQKQRISPKTVQWMVKHYLEKIGLDGQGYSVHKLRHTAATLMYQHGDVNIRVLQELLGHENLSTTEIYTHVSDKQLQQGIEANPLANVKMRKSPAIPDNQTKKEPDQEN